MFEDPPVHTMIAGMCVFTPRRMTLSSRSLRRGLEPFVGADRFDFVRDLGAEMPMQVIGMLLGIPIADQRAVRDRSDSFLRTRQGEPMKLDANSIANGEIFADYIDWRADHPSDDLMTVLLNAEFEDDTGTTRTVDALRGALLHAGARRNIPTSAVRWSTTRHSSPTRSRRRCASNRPAPTSRVTSPATSTTTG